MIKFVANIRLESPPILKLPFKRLSAGDYQWTLVSSVVNSNSHLTQNGSW